VEEGGWRVKREARRREKGTREREWCDREERERQG